jgi:hypothetical protein
MSMSERLSGGEVGGEFLAGRDEDGVRLGDRGLALMMRGIDRVLRRYYGVREFSADPACLLRIAREPAPHPVRLSDGTEIAAGEDIAVLHIWNEQVPRFRLHAGPDLGWAVDVRRRLQQSFKDLARYLAADPESACIRGVHACVVFGNRRRRWQIRRAAARFGFDLIDDPTRPKSLHERGEDVLIWLLTRAFNPAALRRQSFWHDRTELWISREELLRRYL